MKTKWFVFLCIGIGLILLAVLYLLINNEHTTLPFEDEKVTLNLSNLYNTQNETYLGISVNSDEGTDRWIVFYFSYTSSFIGRAQDIENTISEGLEKITILSNEELFFATEETVISVFDRSLGEYNITIAITPSIDELIFQEIIFVEQVILTFLGHEYEFNFSCFMIEKKETLSQELFFSTNATIDTWISESLCVFLSFGIATASNNIITSLSLSFPEGFASISGYEIKEHSLTETGDDFFVIRLTFDKRRDGIIFRPFIRVEYDEGYYGWIIPVIPTYIHG